MFSWTFQYWKVKNVFLANVYVQTSRIYHKKVTKSSHVFGLCSGPIETLWVAETGCLYIILVRAFNISNSSREAMSFQHI